jgi:hypothetical protein
VLTGTSEGNDRQGPSGSIAGGYSTPRWDIIMKEPRTLTGTASLASPASLGPCSRVRLYSQSQYMTFFLIHDALRCSLQLQFIPKPVLRIPSSVRPQCSLVLHSSIGVGASTGRVVPYSLPIGSVPLSSQMPVERPLGNSLPAQKRRGDSTTLLPNVQPR